MGLVCSLIGISTKCCNETPRLTSHISAHTYRIKIEIKKLFERQWFGCVVFMYLSMGMRIYFLNIEKAKKAELVVYSEIFGMNGLNNVKII